MAKATFTLKNGTVVNIDGSIEEIQRLLDIYDNGHQDISQQKAPPQDEEKTEGDIGVIRKPSNDELIRIVALAKTCQEAEAIEKKILENTNEANRALLPLYITYSYLDRNIGLTTSEIDKISTELGARVTRQNTLRALKYSTTGYVNKQGNPARYVINRRGISHIKSVLSDTEGQEETPQPQAKVLTPRRKRKGRSTSSNNKGPQVLVKEIIDSGYFSEKRSVSDVQKRLAEVGRSLSEDNLSHTLLALVRRNKLKRVKDKRRWYYFSE